MHSHMSSYISSLLALVTSSRADTGLLWLTVEKVGHVGVSASQFLFKTS